MSKRGENIYKRKDGRWEGRTLVSPGKYKYFYGKSYREVKGKKKEWVETESRLNHSEDTVCASEAFEIWLKECMQRVKPSTYESYYYCVNKYILPFFRQCEMDTITELHVKKFVNSICENDDLKETYKKKILQIFKTAFREICKDERVKYIDMIKPPKIQDKLFRIFTVQEQYRIENMLLNEMENRSLGLLICFYTGLRLGELCALKWTDVDLKSKTIFITKTVTRIKTFSQGRLKTKLMIGPPKSHTSTRRIPLPEFLCEIIKNEYDSIEDKSGFIVSGTDLPMDPRTYQRYYKKILDHTGLCGLNFHAIRHTFASRALEIGVDVKTLSELLGHSSVTSTLNTYTHSLMEQKKLAIAKMNTLHMDINDVGTFRRQ